MTSRPTGPHDPTNIYDMILIWFWSDSGSQLFWERHMKDRMFFSAKAHKSLTISSVDLPQCSKKWACEPWAAKLELSQYFKMFFAWGSWFSPTISDYLRLSPTISDYLRLSPTISDYLRLVVGYVPMFLVDLRNVCQRNPQGFFAKSKYAIRVSKILQTSED